MGKSIMYRCKECDKEFNKKDPRDKGVFCTHSCYMKNRSNPDNSARNKTCDQCHVRYHATRCNQKFCGSSCAMQWRYAHGFKANTAKAHEMVKLNGFPQKKGKPIPQLHNTETYKKVSLAKTGVAIPKLQGKNHPQWGGGISKDIWKSQPYQAWRKAVMRRDNFTCQLCGDSTGGNLEADHIKPRYLYPELTLVLENGRTLCTDCHKATPTWGYKVKKLARV